LSFAWPSQNIPAKHQKLRSHVKIPLFHCAGTMTGKQNMVDNMARRGAVGEVLCHKQDVGH